MLANLCRDILCTTPIWAARESVGVLNLAAALPSGAIWVSPETFLHHISMYDTEYFLVTQIMFVLLL